MMIKAGDFRPDRDHVVRLFTRHFPVVSSQLHEVVKMSNIEPFWTHLEAGVREACRDIPTDARLSAAASQSVEAVRQSLEAFPDVRDAVVTKMSWSLLNDDMRALFRAGQKSGQIVKRQDGMNAFVNSGVRELFIGSDALRARDTTALRTGVNKAMQIWLESLPPSEHETAAARTGEGGGADAGAAVETDLPSAEVGARSD